ncbi:hypothetical protein [Halocalculus aciditolerans]|uniref:hypothetical protein n=1 Tax=Halocalculus aciditolerans TaxID=1383812 RepID=UPI00166E2D11|nr:hypothetical protein [Halocalculus aciditolerans]
MSADGSSVSADGVAAMVCRVVELNTVDVAVERIDREAIERTLAGSGIDGEALDAALARLVASGDLVETPGGFRPAERES